mmetsp:Transcript_27639/g.69683  ORF Transcript_27639/g.69683 Transcript_27639/m.69683 type:complete len:252 (+) Transcript_27639:324-1079(+)
MRKQIGTVETWKAQKLKKGGEDVVRYMGRARAVLVMSTKICCFFFLLLEHRTYSNSVPARTRVTIVSAYSSSSSSIFFFFFSFLVFSMEPLRSFFSFFAFFTFFSSSSSSSGRAIGTSSSSLLFFRDTSESRLAFREACASIIAPLTSLSATGSPSSIMSMATDSIRAAAPRSCSSLPVGLGIAFAFAPASYFCSLPTTRRCSLMSECTRILLAVRDSGSCRNWSRSTPSFFAASSTSSCGEEDVFPYCSV